MATEQRVPDVLLERFLADDLGTAARRHVEAERHANPELRARLDELAAERQSFLAIDPPAEFARRLAGRLEMEERAAARVAAPVRSRRWLAWVLAPSAAAAVALVATFTVTQMSPEESALVFDAAPAAPQVAPAKTPATDASAPPALEAVEEGRPTELSRMEKRATSRARKFKKERQRAKPGAAKVADEPFEPSPALPPGPKPVVETPAEPEPAADDSAGLDEAVARRALGGAAESKGPLGTEQIAEAVREQTAGLKRCARASKEVAAGDYTIDLVWKITAKGRVKEPKWKGPASLRGTALARCVLDELRTWRFPSAAGATPVRMPIAVTVE